MKTRFFLFFVVLLCVAMPCHAHLLNEYLQATTILLEKDHLILQMRLTPGIDVAGKVRTLLDTNADGVISAAEQRKYAERVRHDVSLAMDGKTIPLRLVSSSLPEVAQVEGGLGDILLTFTAELPASNATRHLTFRNHHQATFSAYLVNCLMPRDPAIHIGAQKRRLQSVLLSTRLHGRESGADIAIGNMFYFCTANVVC